MRLRQACIPVEQAAAGPRAHEHAPQVDSANAKRAGVGQDARPKNFAIAAEVPPGGRFLVLLYFGCHATVDAVACNWFEIT